MWEVRYHSSMVDNRPIVLAAVASPDRVGSSRSEDAGGGEAVDVGAAHQPEEARDLRRAKCLLG